jgi:hypothetical protein
MFVSSKDFPCLFQAWGSHVCLFQAWVSHVCSSTPRNRILHPASTWLVAGTACDRKACLSGLRGRVRSLIHSHLSMAAQNLKGEFRNPRVTTPLLQSSGQWLFVLAALSTLWFDKKSVPTMPLIARLPSRVDITHLPPFTLPPHARTQANLRHPAGMGTRRTDKRGDV